MGIPDSTLHAWARTGSRGERLVTALPSRGREAKMPFIGFAEAHVLAAFRRLGVPLQRIRPAMEKLSGEIGVDHALASKKLYTDGAEVLYDYGAAHDSRELAGLTVVRSGQRQFSEVVRGYLQQITYGRDGWATSVRLPTYRHTEVVVDPRRAFGMPLLTSGGARVEDLVDRFVAGDSVADLVDDFGVPEPEVEDVIRVAAAAA